MIKDYYHFIALASPLAKHRDPLQRRGAFKESYFSSAL